LDGPPLGEGFQRDWWRTTGACWRRAGGSRCHGTDTTRATDMALASASARVSYSKHVTRSHGRSLLAPEVCHTGGTPHQRSARPGRGTYGSGSQLSGSLSYALSRGKGVRQVSRVVGWYRFEFRGRPPISGYWFVTTPSPSVTPVILHLARRPWGSAPRKGAHRVNGYAGPLV
jgi:hypothetical protein